MIKNPPAIQETWVRSLGQEDPLEKELASHSSILDWEIPSIVMGFPGGSVVKKPVACQCRRLRRRGFEPWSRKILCRRKWQPTPVFLPGKSHGQRSLAGYSLWGHRAGHDLATKQQQ